MENIETLSNELRQSIKNDDFVKITLSKPTRKSNDLQNIYVRQITLKGNLCFQFTYRFKTNDQVKNFDTEQAILILEEHLLNDFNAGTLFTLSKDLLIFISKKKKVSFKVNNPSFKNKLPEHHDKQKEKRVVLAPYLHHLGITDSSNKLIPKMADKYRQINKYLEIIEGELSSVNTSKELNLVDMGSGKGYLTFALYDYLVNSKQLNVSITGIELRKSLVDYCNKVSEKCGFENLNFIAERIEHYNERKIDVLIALHACDTATDDAIFKGLSSKSDLIICAPCCHKQMRQQVKGKVQENPILKYGIFKERHFEMVTDTIRALILEKHQYNTKVFEFISSEHTSKNVMIIASKSSKKKDITYIDNKISVLKQAYQIDYHYLEKLL